MKRVVPFVLVLVAACAPAPSRQQITESLKAQAEELARAMEDDKHERIADLTHPKMLEKAGGRRKVLQGLEAFSRHRKSRWSYQAVRIEEPTGAAEKNGNWYGVVPYTLTLVGDDKRRISQTSFLLGVSFDGGKVWQFMDGNRATPQQITEVMPDFPSELVIPAVGQPVIKDPEQ